MGSEFDIKKFDAEVNRRATERVASQIVNKLDEADGKVDGQFKDQDKIYKALGVAKEEQTPTEFQVPYKTAAMVIKEKIVNQLKGLFDSYCFEDNIAIAQKLIDKLGLNINVARMLSDTFDEVHLEMMKETNKKLGREFFKALPENGGTVT